MGEFCGARQPYGAVSIKFYFTTNSMQMSLITINFGLQNLQESFKHIAMKVRCMNTTVALHLTVA